MTFELLFTFLSALVWPVVSLLLSLLSVLAGLLLCIFVVGWLLLRARQPDTFDNRRPIEKDKKR